jgi:2-hydroxychromene-2-carboxylate isomerase
LKPIVFWFDPISPFAYLAFERLPQALEGCTYAVDYRPVLFAGLLNHWGQKGPAEIEPKRAWTFRHIAWLAHQHNIDLQMPAAHPFNPLPLLRLAIAAGPNRRVVEALMRHVWRGGADPADAVRIDALTRELAPARDPSSDEVKAEQSGEEHRSVVDAVGAANECLRQVLEGEVGKRRDRIEPENNRLQALLLHQDPSMRVRARPAAFAA